MVKVIIYTDGACRGNPGPGGWGAVLRCGNTEKTISGAEKFTTNNRMELLAAIRALQSLKKECTVEIYTDSNYVKQGITSWLFNWKKNGWKNSKKEPVKNADLWKELDQTSLNHVINWHWVKGHSGNEGNEKADNLATSAIDKLCVK